MSEAELTEEQVTMAKLVRDFKVVVQDAEMLAKATAGDLGDRVREARNRLAASIEGSKVSFQRLEEKAKDGLQAGDAVIREHPYQSIGLAFGVGLLLGVLVARK